MRALTPIEDRSRRMVGSRSVRSYLPGVAIEIANRRHIGGSRYGEHRHVAVRCRLIMAMMVGRLVLARGRAYCKHAKNSGNRNYSSHRATTRGDAPLAPHVMRIAWSARR